MTEFDEIVDVFNLLEDWESRYQYLIEIGERLPPMAVADKTEDRRVKACMSRVWVKAEIDADNRDRVNFQGDCDTAIIKGVLALLVRLASGKTVEAIQKLDVDVLFKRLSLDKHLSPNRHVGVYAIFELMKKQALALSTEMPLAGNA